MTADRWIALSIWGGALALTAAVWLAQPSTRPWRKDDE